MPPVEKSADQETLRWACIACGRRLKAPRSAVGKRITCPHCRRPAAVPGTLAAPDRSVFSPYAPSAESEDAPASPVEDVIEAVEVESPFGRTSGSERGSEVIVAELAHKSAPTQPASTRSLASVIWLGGTNGLSATAWNLLFCSAAACLIFVFGYGVFQTATTSSFRQMDIVGTIKTFALELPKLIVALIVLRVGFELVIVLSRISHHLARRNGQGE